ncbi:hypothetical protein BROUX41_001445 [Berkeleyomyces rouxiae]|uniref:uncharacterized protein n=1 Tax=Berkeleyomyces rouxiae TaxID=2035830 RepID=UPI003B8250BE
MKPQVWSIFRLVVTPNDPAGATLAEKPQKYDGHFASKGHTSTTSRLIRAKYLGFPQRRTPGMILSKIILRLDNKGSLKSAPSSGTDFLEEISVSFSLHVITGQVCIHDHGKNGNPIVFTSETHAFWNPNRTLFLSPTTNHEFQIRNVNLTFAVVWDKGWLEMQKNLLKDIPADLLVPLPDSKLHDLRLGRFRYIELETLGSGATSRVVKAMHVDTGEVVSVKQLNSCSDSSFRQLALKEAYVLKKLCHSSIIQFIRVDQVDGDVDLTLAYKPYTVLEAANLKLFQSNLDIHTDRFMHQMLESLQYLNISRIVHLDIKPENILCAPSSTSGNYDFFLTDFGLTMPFGSLACLVGTIGFIPPKLETSSSLTCFHPSMDIYSLFMSLFTVRYISKTSVVPSYTDMHRLVHSYDTDSYLSNYLKMANLVPETRPLASDLLFWYFPSCDGVCFARSSRQKDGRHSLRQELSLHSPVTNGATLFNDGCYDHEMEPFDLAKDTCSELYHNDDESGGFAYEADDNESDRASNRQLTPQSPITPEAEIEQLLYDLWLCAKIAQLGRKKRMRTGATRSGSSGGKVWGFH